MSRNEIVISLFHSSPSLGWWFVSIGQEEGWAPCSYMEKLNGQDEEEEFTSSGELLCLK